MVHVQEYHVHHNGVAQTWSCSVTWWYGRTNSTLARKTCLMHLPVGIVLHLTSTCVEQIQSYNIMCGLMSPTHDGFISLINTSTCRLVTTSWPRPMCKPLRSIRYIGNKRMTVIKELRIYLWIDLSYECEWRTKKTYFQLWKLDFSNNCFT